MGARTAHAGQELNSRQTLVTHLRWHLEIQFLQQKYGVLFNLFRRANYAINLSKLTKKSEISNPGASFVCFYLIVAYLGVRHLEPDIE